MTGKAPDIEHVSQESQHGTWLILKTPDYDTVVGGNQLSYLRLGSPDVQRETPLLTTRADVKAFNFDKDAKKDREPAAGWFEYTDGDRTIVTVGGKKEFVGGGYELHVNGDKSSEEKYVSIMNKDHKVEWGLVSSTECLFGDKEGFFFGCQMDVTGGLGVSLDLCGKFGATLGIDVDVFLGYKIEVGRSYNFSNTEGDDLRLAHNIAQEAREGIHLSVQGMHETTWSRLGSVLGKKAAATAAVATLLSTAVSGGVGNINKERGLGASMGATVLYALLMCATLREVLRAKKDNKDGKPLSELKMDKDGIWLGKRAEGGRAAASLILREWSGGEGYVDLRSSGGASLMLDSRVAELDSPKTINLRAGKAKMVLKDTGDLDLGGQELKLRGKKIEIGGALTINGDAYTPPPPPPPAQPQKSTDTGPRLNKRPQPPEW